RDDIVEELRAVLEQHGSIRDDEQLAVGAIARRAFAAREAREHLPEVSLEIRAFEKVEEPAAQAEGKALPVGHLDRPFACYPPDRAASVATSILLEHDVGCFECSDVAPRRAPAHVQVLGEIVDRRAFGAAEELLREIELARVNAGLRAAFLTRN